MLVPMGVMAFMTISLIWAPLNPFSPEHAWLVEGIHPSGFLVPTGFSESSGGHVLITGISLLVLIIGLGTAYFKFRPSSGKKFNNDQDVLSKMLAEQFYLDWIYEKGIAPAFLAFTRLSHWVDQKVIDGMVNGIANGVVRNGSNLSIAAALGWWDKKIVDGLVNLIANWTMGIGDRIRKIQAGKVQLYLFWTIGAVLLLLAALIYFTRG